MISLRKITASDTRNLVDWRNADAEFFGGPLTYEGHNVWYDLTYLNNPRDHMYMVMCEGNLVGTIAVILGDKRGTEISRVLLGDKEWAQQGVMSEALNLLIDIYPSPHWLRVKPGNSRAIRFYQKNGFALSGKTDTDLLMTSYLTALSIS